MSKVKKKRINRVYSAIKVKQFKSRILNLFDTQQVKTLTEAAEKLQISPSIVHSWTAADEEFRNALKQGREIIADKLFRELLGVEPNAKMPLVTAKIFLLKGLRPEFRDSYKSFEIQDEKTREFFETLIKLGQKGKDREAQEAKEKAENPPEEKPKRLPNPFKETIERLREEKAKQQMDEGCLTENSENIFSFN